MINKMNIVLFSKCIGITVIYVPPCFGYPRIQIPGNMGVPLSYYISVLGILGYPAEKSHVSSNIPKLKNH